MREHFADCGDVVAVRIVRDRQSGMGKGFGYVLFEVCMNVRLQDTCQNLNWELLLRPYLTLALFEYACDVRRGSAVLRVKSSSLQSCGNYCRLRTKKSSKTLMKEINCKGKMQ